MKKNKWPKPAKSVNIPIYGGVVHLFESQIDFLKAEAFLSGSQVRDVDPCYDGHATHFTSVDSGASSYMIGWYSGNLSTLVHELGHVCVFILKHAGMRVEDSDGEAFCYLQGWLFDQFIVSNK